MAACPVAALTVLSPHRHLSTWLTSTNTVPSFSRAITRRGFLKIPPQGEKSFESVQQTRTKERGSSTPSMAVWTPKAQDFSSWIQAMEPSQQQKASVPSPCLSTPSRWWWVLTKPCWVHQLGWDIWVTGEIKVVLAFEGGFVWNNREEESRVLTFTVWLNVVNTLHSSSHLLWRATGFL